MTPPILPQRWSITSADAVDDPGFFPLLVGQSFLTGKTPIWSTAIATSASGRERRQARWSYPKWQFKIAYEVLNDRPDAPDLQRLWTFFNFHAGQAGSFAYLDPSDCIANDMAFATGDGATRVFQLSRTQDFGAMRFTEPLHRVAGIPRFFVDGVETDASLDGSGFVTFASAPVDGAAISWTGRFAFLVRFAADQLEAAQLMQALWSQGGLQLLSVRN